MVLVLHSDASILILVFLVARFVNLSDLDFALWNLLGKKKIKQEK